MCFCWYFVSLSQVRYEHPYHIMKEDVKASSFLFGIKFNVTLSEYFRLDFCREKKFFSKSA